MCLSCQSWPRAPCAGVAIESRRWQADRFAAAVSYPSPKLPTRHRAAASGLAAWPSAKLPNWAADAVSGRACPSLNRPRRGVDGMEVIRSIPVLKRPVSICSGLEEMVGFALVLRAVSRGRSKVVRELRTVAGFVAWAGGSTCW